jgi:hypothetical protein
MLYTIFLFYNTGAIVLINYLLFLTNIYSKIN